MPGIEPIDEKTGENVGSFTILWGEDSHIKRLCHSTWLLHLHSTVNIQPFYPVFPLGGLHG